MTSVIKSFKSFVVFFLIIFTLFKYILYGTFLINVCLLIVAGYTALLLSRFVFNFFPRRKISSIGNAILITSCDTKIGILLAQQLDKLGFKVFAGTLNPQSTDSHALASSCSNNLSIIPLDVTDKQQVESAYEFICENLNKKQLWAIVNNATLATVSEFEWCPFEIFEKMFAVNTIGSVRVCKTFLPILRESEGRIIIVGSLAGRYTYPGFTAYSMTKHANTSFADGLRREMKKWKIQVSTIESCLYKSSIADETSLKANLQEMWNNLPEDIREIYGDEYFSAFLDSVSHQLVQARSDVQEVVSCIIHSIISCKPKITYVPNFVVQLRTIIFESLPTWALDAILSLKIPNVFSKSKLILK